MIEFSESEISQYFPMMECIFYAAGSVQRFARPFLNVGLHVFSAWAANAVSVAAYRLAQIVIAAKGYFGRLHLPGSNAQLSREWTEKIVQNLTGNYQMTVGIIGVGMIGKWVAEHIRRNMEHIRILAFDPFLPMGKADELEIEWCDLQTLFEQSDVIFNHMAIIPELSVFWMARFSGG